MNICDSIVSFVNRIHAHGLKTKETWAGPTAVVGATIIYDTYYYWCTFCEGVVVPEGGREGTQGYQLRLETAPVLLYRFLIIGVEL